MAIDWIKVLIPPKKWAELINHCAYDGVKDEYRQVDLGEARFKDRYYRGLRFRFKKGRIIELSGSLHFYKNCGVHNADDFTIEELINVLNELGKIFNLNWFECRILNFEFGVNICLPYSIVSLLNGCLLHSKIRFNVDKQGRSKEIEHQRYYGKLYDKVYWIKCRKIEMSGMSEKINENILRIEIKTRRMHDFKAVGLTHVPDLLNFNVNEFLLSELTQFWDGIVFYDPTINTVKVLEENPKSNIRRYSDETFWVGMIPGSDSDEKLKNTMRMKYKRNIANLRYYASEFGENVQTEIRELIEEKWKQLYCFDNLKCTLINQSEFNLNVPCLTA